MAFQKGQSGNPAGRPKGIPNPAARLRKRIEKDVPGIIEAMVTAAQSGDTAAAKLLLERVIPPLKAQGTPVALPMGETLTDTGRNVLEAVAGGAVTVEQAGLLMGGLGTLAKLVETDELIRRIEALESKSCANN